jgi:hypothetical protein
MAGKTLAVHMLSGNFATNRVTSLNNKANSINPSAFLPQGNVCMVEQQHFRDMITNTKKSVDILGMHKSKAETSIARIGTMTSILDFSSLCINMDLIIMAITTTDSPLPILHQFLMKFIRLINNTKWACWYDAIHAHMPQIHCHCYSLLEKIFNHVANFATDFGNVNVSELNFQPLVHAITMLRAFEDNIILHQSLGTPIVTMASFIEAYTLNPWKKTNSCINSSPDDPP